MAEEEDALALKARKRAIVLTWRFEPFSPDELRQTYETQSLLLFIGIQYK